MTDYTQGGQHVGMTAPSAPVRTTPTPPPTGEAGRKPQTGPPTGIDPSGERAEPAEETAGTAKGAVGSAASDIAHGAYNETSHVASNIADQARRVVEDAKVKAAGRLDNQQKQWSQQIGDVSRELQKMASNRPETPARAVVTKLAERSSMFADYLADHRVEDVLAEVQTLARRRPGTFLMALAAAGFVAGRVGKGMAQAQAERRGDHGGMDR